jgi:hypothetical protein
VKLLPLVRNMTILSLIRQLGEFAGPGSGEGGPALPGWEDTHGARVLLIDARVGPDQTQPGAQIGRVRYLLFGSST